MCIQWLDKMFLFVYFDTVIMVLKAERKPREVLGYLQIFAESQLGFHRNTFQRILVEEPAKESCPLA